MPGSVSPWAEIAVAVLAAGQGSRFGSDKLMADLDGRPMALHVAEILSELPFGWRFAVCSKGAALVQHFSAVAFATIENAAPEKGQSHSLHLAVEAAGETDAKALLVVLADMPFVSAAHIERLIGAGDGIIASTAGNRPTPPALFPRSVWPMLLATTGDAGARDMLRDATLVNATETELRDIDVVTDLHETQAR
jgi:molybdenum cofactor cytidylyltransferase